MIANYSKFTKVILATTVTAAFTLISTSATAKQCMHRMGHYPHHVPHKMHYNYGPKWQHAYKHGYVAGAHHGQPMYNEKSGEASAGKDLVDTAIEAGSFNTLVEALDAAGLKELLKGDGPYTVFAPTDEAFAKLPEGQLDQLLADKERLAAVLKFHVIPKRVSALDVLQAQELPTAEGQALSVADIEVAKADIETNNGIIHIVDSVLLPTTQ